MPCPTHDACISWTATSEYTDNTPITRPITYKILRNGVMVSTTISVSTQLVNEPTGRQCYRVVATVDNVDSAQSNEICRTIRLETPTDGGIE